MSIFREHKTIADRSARDRKRHKQKIEKAIKDGIHDIVAEESIIGKDGKKKIRIPVRGIKEYRFVYGNNEANKKVGSAPDKDIRRGQKIGEGQKQQSQGDKPGNEKGDEFYEVEITLEELSHYLFSSLELPDLEKKALTQVSSDKIKRKGYRPQGIKPRLDKKKSVIKKIKRLKAQEKEKMPVAYHWEHNPSDGSEIDDDSNSFHDSDLVYRHFKPTKKFSSNAVIFFVMDVSGSMTKEKKFIARSFYFLLYHFIRSKYENTELVFISHDTAAKEVSEEQFFTRGSSGGTLVSSGLELVHEVIQSRYHPSSWNVYAFQCSDGDNWPEDTEKVLSAIDKIKQCAQFVGYAEIDNNQQGGWFEDSKLSKVYEPRVDKKFKVGKIQKKEEIWPLFKKFFGARS